MKYLDGNIAKRYGYERTRSGSFCYKNKNGDKWVHHLGSLRSFLKTNDAGLRELGYDVCKNIDKERRSNEIKSEINLFNFESFDFQVA